MDLTSGNRTLISNFNNPAQGPIGINPFGITMGSSGNLLVTDEDITQGPTINGSLLEVDVVSGFRTVISDFENPAQGPLGNEPQGITTNLLGQALIAERNGQSGGGRGFLFLVDTTTGDRTIISDFGNPAQGPLGSDPTGIAYRLPLRNVPTLSQWGLIATAGLLGIIGFLVIRRRQLATNK
ncbi:MAG: IPTL-CTERM sorting domain-containing protein [Thermodesulfobacteriota bacterium]